MAKGEILFDSSNVNSDLFYKVGVFIPDPFIFFKVENDEFVVVKSLEYARVKSFAKKSVKVLMPEDLVGEKGSNADEKEMIEAIVNKYSISLFRIPSTFPVYLADFIRNLNVELNVIEGNFYPERICKDQSEIKKLREAGHVVEFCLGTVENILRESKVDSEGVLVWNGEHLTSEIMHQEVNVAAVRKHATPIDTIVASGIHSSQPHNVGSGVIKSGQPIVVDIFPRMNVSGYWGDMTRTFAKGKAPDIVKKAYKAVSEAKKTAIQAMKAGVIASDICKLAKDVLDNHGFYTGRDSEGENFGFFHSLGHGVGLDIHEAPLIGLKNNNELKENSVVTVEPGVYYKEWGGVRLEDMVLITAEGVEVITSYPEVLEID